MAPAEANSFRFSLLPALSDFFRGKQGGMSRLPSIHQRKCWIFGFMDFSETHGLKRNTNGFSGLRLPMVGLHGFDSQH